MERFSPEVRESLLAQGWRLSELPGDVTLEALRQAGAPFKGDKFFREHAFRLQAAATSPTEVAFRPGLMPQSLNGTTSEIDHLLLRLDGMLPSGARAGLGAAASYVWLLQEHHKSTGEWLLKSCFTMTLDRVGDAVAPVGPAGELAVGTGVPVVVGVFGGERPILVSPLPEGRGRGVGLMPLVVPGNPTARALR
jgi:hypothetical protein